MLRRRTAHNIVMASATMLASGTLLATSCSTDEVQAIVAGIEAITQSLDDSDRDNDMNFGEWLINEIED